MDKDPGSSGGEFSDNDKEILYRAMYSAQPNLSDFRGYPGFPNKMLQADQNWLNEKNADIFYSEKEAADDDFARYMEPVITYILNREELLPSRDNFSFLASDYDDKRNGTDIVFGVKNLKTDSHTVLSIDVATGTLLKNIQGKFYNSFNIHNGTSYVKYCMHNDQRWREPDAPHFILGMSPASQNKAVDKIIIKNGELKGRETDLDSDFILLSEIREQIQMQLAILKNDPSDASAQRITKLNNLMPAITTGLYRTLEINSSNYHSKEDRSQAFKEKYALKNREISRSDKVYNNIVTIARQRARGAKALQA